MVPEISHRCPACGVSVRESDALFCPECGKPLAEPASANASPEPAEPNSPEADKEGTVVAESSRPASDSDVAASNPETSTDEPEEAPRVRRPGEKTRERLHRASEMARGVTRGVIEEPAKRVEKIRQASNVVIEEASYDPSLRFVLVAFALFAVFVILLVLSKVMG